MQSMHVSQSRVPTVSVSFGVQSEVSNPNNSSRRQAPYCKALATCKVDRRRNGCCCRQTSLIASHFRARHSLRAIRVSWGFVPEKSRPGPRPAPTQACVIMLQRSCRLRKLVQLALVDAVPIRADLKSSASTSRQFSNLPEDYASHRVVMPVRAARKAELTPQQPGPDAQASSSTTASTFTPASALQQGAQTGTLLSKSQLYKLQVYRLR